MCHVACLQTHRQTYTQTERLLRVPFQCFRILSFNLSSRIGPIYINHGPRFWCKNTVSYHCGVQCAHCFIIFTSFLRENINAHRRTLVHQPHTKLRLSSNKHGLLKLCSSNSIRDTKKGKFATYVTCVFLGLKTTNIWKHYFLCVT